MGLSEEQVREVQRVAELEVRRYFDDYLQNVFPTQVTAVISAHHTDPYAHGGVEDRFNRLFWTLIGLAGGSGVAVGGGVATLLQAVLFG